MKKATPKVSSLKKKNLIKRIKTPKKGNTTQDYVIGVPVVAQ